MYYINYFFIFSCLGHLLESIINSKSGILFGYWTPVYGFGTIIILITHKILDKYIKSKNKFIKIIILFFTCLIILSLIEALGGYLIKWIFNKDMWDYSSHKLNLGKYASIEMGIVWGISSIVLIYLLKPIIDKFIYKIPKIITIILLILFAIDSVYSLLIKEL